MAFEAVTQTMPVLTTISDVFDCALGVRAYPWERVSAEQPPAWRQSRLRALIEPCLARDPQARPSSATMLAAIERIGQASVTAG